MHKVFLFGSRDLGSIPEAIEQHIVGIIEQTQGQVEFIMGDATGVDAGFQKCLASIGASSMGTVYCMDTARNNRFELKTQEYKVVFDEETSNAQIQLNGALVEDLGQIKSLADVLFTRDYYAFKDNQMIDCCDFAICYWDKKSKGTMRNIQKLKARDKYVYVYTREID